MMKITLTLQGSSSLPVGPGWISRYPYAPVSKLSLLMSKKDAGPAWSEGDGAAHHQVLLVVCLALCRDLLPAGLGDITAVINTLQTFCVPCDCRQELEYLNTNPTDAFMVQETETDQIAMSFSDLIF